MPVAFTQAVADGIVNDIHARGAVTEQRPANHRLHDA
jgi:hypothetical protein